jgi:anti-anti-sigma regulatory factor
MSADKFKMVTFNEAHHTLIKVSGRIDELAQFPEMRSEGKITIDLSNVTLLNSVGTRTWCLWIQRFREPAEVILIGCPPIMVRSFTMIKGFLGKTCRVASFVIPYYSDRSGERKNFIAVLGEHYDHGGNLRLPDVKDSQGHTMEIDVIPETYFAFLKP